MASIRVLTVDDHEVVRAGVQTALASVDGIDVVGEASTADEAVERALALRPDAVLMDVRLGNNEDLDGIDACRAVRSALPETKVLMFSSYSERETVLAAIVAGASGYLTKHARRGELISAIRAVARGEVLLDPKITRLVIEQLQKGPPAGAPQEDVLSAREQEVLALLAEGLTNREIGERLTISEYTARNHVATILNKLGLSNRTAAAALAARMGI
jgi:DNA-binding NarL/FixJ family response regulator